MVIAVAKREAVFAQIAAIEAESRGNSGVDVGGGGGGNGSGG